MSSISQEYKVYSRSQSPVQATETHEILCLRFLGSKHISIVGWLWQWILNRINPNANRSITYPWWQRIHPLSNQTICCKNLLKFCCINAALHKCNPTWVEPFAVKMINPDTLEMTKHDLLGMQLREHCYLNLNSGLKIGIFVTKDQRIVISYGAVGSHSSEVDKGSKKDRALQRKGYINAMTNLFGVIPNMYVQAEQFTQQLCSKLQQDVRYRDYKVCLTGQCLGGSIAAYLGLRLRKPTVCVNSFPIGAGLQAQIGSAQLSQADRYVTHVISSGDIFGDNRVFIFSLVLRLIDFICTRIIAITTPGNFGQTYRLQNQYSTFASPKKLLQTHQLMIFDLIHELRQKDHSNCSEINKFVASNCFKAIVRKMENYQIKHHITYP